MNCIIIFFLFASSDELSTATAKRIYVHDLVRLVRQVSAQRLAISIANIATINLKFKRMECLFKMLSMIAKSTLLCHPSCMKDAAL